MSSNNKEENVIEPVVLLNGRDRNYFNLSDPSIPKELENVQCNLFLSEQTGVFIILGCLHPNFLPAFLHELFIWVFHIEHSLKRWSLVCLLPDPHH